MKDFTYLDRYINNENLRDDELRYMHLDPVKMLAYDIKGNTNYGYVYGMVAMVQRTYKHGAKYYKNEVFYIIDATGLTKWQKFWLKFSYVFL